MVRIAEPLLGTRAEISITARSDAAASAAQEAVLAEVARLEAVFSIFDETSDLHALRRTGTTRVPELLEVLDLALAWCDRSGGAFHPAAASLSELWLQAEAKDRLPTALERETAATAVAGPPQLEVLDLNAIAKGWIADRALRSRMLVDRNLASGWLSLGGDVVHRGDGSVRVGIEDPHRPYDNAEPLASVELSNEALATSGGARRWWTIAGERYSKVLDPRTAQPVDHVASATVIARDGATADVLATIALVLTPEEALGVVAEEGADCLLVDRDGGVRTSSGRFEFTTPRTR